MPESLLVLDVLAEMRRVRRTFAVVVDEFGGVAGVITVKDLLAASWETSTTSSIPGASPRSSGSTAAAGWSTEERASTTCAPIGLALPEGQVRHARRLHLRRTRPHPGRRRAPQVRRLGAPCRRDGPPPRRQGGRRPTHPDPQVRTDHADTWASPNSELEDSTLRSPWGSLGPLG